jgi:ParB family transcriptional regulator, chromosome partitioning protein
MSIRESGLIQPLVVRERQGRYELIAGERRWRACRIAGLTEVPVVIKDASDHVAYTLALIENIQRQDLSPLEEARAYQRLLEEEGVTQASLAKMVGKSRAAVANSVRLLQLPEKIQSQLATGALSAGHARALVTLEADDALAVAERIVEQGWNVRDAEEAARRVKEGLPMVEQAAPVAQAAAEGHGQAESEPRAAGKAQGPAYRDDAQLRSVVDELQKTLGLRVKIKDRAGRGRLEISYDSKDALNDVLDRLRGR